MNIDEAGPLAQTLFWTAVVIAGLLGGIGLMWLFERKQRGRRENS